MRVYIAGPMSGLPGLNFPAFDAAAERMRALGHTPVNPADFDRLLWPDHDFSAGCPPPKFNYVGTLRSDLHLLDTCDAIYFLPGSENSVGATLERAWAAALHLPEIKDVQ